MSIKSAIESQASYLIENWLSNGWKNRGAADDICSLGDDGTSVIGLNGDERMSLAEDYIEIYGGLNELIGKSGLSGAIWQAASSMTIYYGESLARELAQHLETFVEYIEQYYIGWNLFSVTENDPLGDFAPRACKDLQFGHLTEYRNIENSFDADVLQLQITITGELDSQVSETIHVRFDRPTNRAA